MEAIATRATALRGLQASNVHANDPVLIDEAKPDLATRSESGVGS